MAKLINRDAECVYDFVMENFTGVTEKDIVVLGRSLGSGPCIHLGVVRNPAYLIVCSPFRSIKAVVKEKVSVLAGLFDEEFDNINKIKQIRQPILFVHGAKDSFIDPKHSYALCKECPSQTKKVIIRENMTHNSFDFYRDWAVPIGSFLYAISKNAQQKQGRRSFSSLDAEAGDPWHMDKIFYQDIDFDRYFRRKRI